MKLVVPQEAIRAIARDAVAARDVALVHVACDVEGRGAVEVLRGVVVDIGHLLAQRISVHRLLPKDDMFVLGRKEGGAEE